MIDLIWDCTVIIYNEELDDLPNGADAPPRRAVIEAIENLGLSIHSVSSGWGVDDYTPKIAKLKRRIASLENECVKKHLPALRAQLDSKWVSASNPPKTEGTYICCTIPPKFLEAFLCGNYIPETENIFGCMFENGKFTEINFSGGDSEIGVDFYIQLPEPPDLLEDEK